MSGGFSAPVACMQGNPVSRLASQSGILEYTILAAGVPHICEVAYLLLLHSKERLQHNSAKEA